MLAHSSGGTSLDRDPLSQVLQDLRIVDGSYGRCELGSAWGIEFPPQPEARFHFVVEGQCWLRAPKRGWIPLGEGDVALLPRGTGHSMSHHAKGRLKPLDEMPLEEIGDRTFEMRTGGSKTSTVLVCCSVAFDQPAVHPLLDLMPAALVVRRGMTRDAFLPLLLDAMAHEVREKRVGAATVMTRLADVVITRVIRSWVEERNHDGQDWLAAIRDPQIGKALAAMHEKPGEPWTVESLAEVSGVSRSVFSERFAALVGVPPARYLARWRVHLAASWLKKDRVNVNEVAARLGYESEAAFSRVFKRFMGRPPSAVKREAREARLDESMF